ncbi:MAG TPA: gliding motility-associated C-terminal domain-containing protein, partial [Brumimicrobium sp.]|nr:gliding motility-associated C-terminal domain-containing protein [Brumimicrobium sp.]
DPCDLVVEHQTVPPSQDWLEGDCDGDGVTNGDELALGGDIFDACSPNVCTLFVPEIFTPDGDGINDYWRIDGIENYPNNTLVIMNRWGNVVYETEGYNNEWNGFSTSGLNVGGDELPTGTYYYVLDSKNSEIGVLKGYIYLQR